MIYSNRVPIWSCMVHVFIVLQDMFPSLCLPTLCAWYIGVKKMRDTPKVNPVGFRSIRISLIFSKDPFQEITTSIPTAVWVSIISVFMFPPCQASRIRPNVSKCSNPTLHAFLIGVSSIWTTWNFLKNHFSRVSRLGISSSIFFGRSETTHQTFFPRGRCRFTQKPVLVFV